MIIGDIKENRMIEITDKSQCCGCSACAQICPKNCICMKVDEEGFEYPRVDSQSCIDCGLCDKSCPVKCTRPKNIKEIQSYVAYAKNDTLRMKSSSGAIFSLCSENILRENGVVFGAAFDENFMVRHISIENMKEMKYLRGSKYLQSRIEDTYQETKRFLNAGRKVLYTGTECQIAGLKQYLGKDYSNLYTIDVLCHGVPSPKVWDRFLRGGETKYNSAIKQVFFRQKSHGWKNYSIKIQFSNAKQYDVAFHDDAFMQVFLRDICLRPSCHDCKFKDLDRTSDLTIGDCWGIENFMPDMDDDKGTSIVLTHSSKGQNLFASCREDMVFRQAETDKVLPPSADSRKSVEPHPKRQVFFKRLNRGESIEELVKLTNPPIYSKITRKMKRLIKRVV